jgi:lipoprotein-releasing system ATP-binding protein
MPTGMVVLKSFLPSSLINILKMLSMKRLKMPGMQDQVFKLSSKLSGVQQQHVVIAGAMINEPAIIMVDELTGNLESNITTLVIDIFKGLDSNFHQTIIIVTHDEDFARKSERIIEINDATIHYG